MHTRLCKKEEKRTPSDRMRERVRERHSSPARETGATRERSKKEDAKANLLNLACFTVAIAMPCLGLPWLHACTPVDMNE